MATLHRAWCVLCTLTARKSAHGYGHGHGQKAGKNAFLDELRHKGGCCCFGWAVYVPWACYMNLRVLCVSKKAQCPLIGMGNLAGDQRFMSLNFNWQNILLSASAWVISRVVGVTRNENGERRLLIARMPAGWMRMSSCFLRYFSSPWR